jgi:hypothetical protein
MRTLTGMIAVSGFMIVGSLAVAQRPDGPPGGPRAGGRGDLVDRMLEFDKDQDGKLTNDEITDPRLHRLFDQADADKDGIVTRQELTALASQQSQTGRGGPPGFGPPGGGFRMGPPRPGEILPPMLQQRLRLSDAQKAQLKELQKEVDDKLNKILTSEQQAQLKEMRQRGPGGFGPPGGGRPGGYGPPGDGPPPPPGFGPPPGEGLPPPRPADRPNN